MSGVNSAGNPVGQKRKYRRHPKQTLQVYYGLTELFTQADEFAPERPPSAYVIFSNQMRDKLKGQDLSFTEIAKIVGEHWQELSPQEKEPCERQAQALKEKYYAELNEYKKTPRYTEYQEYLAEFKARDNSKKPKSEAETVGSTRSNSQDRGDKHSELQHDVSRMRIAQSPTTLGKSDNKIAWIGSMSPGSQARRYSVASHRGEDELDKAFFPHVSGFRPLSSEAPTEDGLWASASSKRQGRPLHLLSGPTHSSSNSTDGIAHNANASPSPSMMYQNLTSGDNQVYPPRRVTTTTNTLPSPIPALTRNGTTKSSISESSVSSSSWSTNSLSAINETNVQSHRVLPPPTPSAAPTDGASRSKAQSSKPSNPGSSLSELSSLDSRTKSSLATLLRAGEQLDRDAEQKIPISNITRPRDRPWES
ncbi:hypothetical protein MBLNU459_g8373t2 [Dothideomycetes sp. NU459]